MTTKPDQGDAKFEWHAGYLGVHDRRQGGAYLCMVWMEETYQGELLLCRGREGRSATIPLEDAAVSKKRITCRSGNTGYASNRRSRPTGVSHDDTNGEVGRGEPDDFGSISYLLGQHD